VNTDYSFRIGVTMLLAGDIGGTKSILAIYSREDGPQSPLAETTYNSRDYPGLETMATDFLKRTGLHVTEGAFGVAGPVVDGRTIPSNLAWVIEGTALASALNLSQAHLFNDLEGIARGILHLADEDFQTLNEGSAQPEGTLAVIAPGTGLGAAFMTWNDKEYRVHPSEGGHGDFSPSTSLERDLLNFLTETRDHVSCEMVCSGTGIPNIYDFLRIHEKMKVPEWLSSELALASDPTPVIINSALNLKRECYICRRTLEIFASILGGEAGNLALTVMATGGVYLGGGIPPRILPALQSGSFMEGFTRKGRMSEIMRNIPIRVIMNPKAALIGAAIIGLERMSKEPGDRSQETDWLRFSH
jgi:glucokinase